MSDAGPKLVQRIYTKEDEPVRQKAKALCLTGVSRQEICKRLSVSLTQYDKWVQRGGWTILRAQLASGGTITLTEKPRVFALRETAREKAAKLLAGFPEKCPKTPRAAKDLMAAFAHTVSSISLIEGWSDGPKVAVDLDFLSQPVDRVALSAPQSTTLDSSKPSEVSVHSPVDAEALPQVESNYSVVSNPQPNETQ